MGSPAGKSYSGMHLSPATNCLVLYSCWGWFRRHKKWGEIYGSHPDPNKDTQLWNIWQCCILVQKHESHLGLLLRIRLLGNKMDETTKQIPLVLIYPDYTLLHSVFVCPNPHFSSSVAQTLCTSPGLQLIHVSGLIGDKNHQDSMAVSSKSAVALSKKLDTALSVWQF